MKYAWHVVFIMSAPFLTIAVFFPPSDGDLAWQRWLGKTILATHRIPRALGYETFSATGASWTPQEWLFSIAASLGDQYHQWIFAAAIALCATATLALIAYRAVRRGAYPIDAALATGVAGIALSGSFGVRAQVVAWPILALFLLLLDNDGPGIWAAVPVAALWSNFHASAMLAPLFAGSVCIGKLLEDRAWTPRVGRLAGVTAAAGVAICCNPFGIGLPLYAISLFDSPIRTYIIEWQAPNAGGFPFLFGALPLLLGTLAAAAWGRSRRALRAEDAPVFAASAFLMFSAARNIAIFAIIAAPLCARALTQAWVRPPRDSSSAHPKRVGIPLPVFTVLLALLLASSVRDVKQPRFAMPFREMNALVQTPGEHRIMCMDFSWCSYFLGLPKQRVFLDGRADPYPPQIWEEFAVVVYARPGWPDVVDRYRVNAVIAKRDTEIDRALARTRQWKDATHDSQFRLWMRGPSHRL